MTGEILTNTDPNEADLDGTVDVEIGKLNSVELTEHEEILASSALQTYFRQLGKVRGEDSYTNLTREEERDLSKRIEKGDFAAKEELINANLRLVVKVAKYKARDDEEFLDRIQDGSVGLIRAAEKFDWRRGYKFSTYAMWWIRQSIDRSQVNTGDTIRIPTHVHNDIKKIRKVRQQFEVEGASDPTPEQISERTDLSLDKVNELLSYMQTTTVASLDKPISEGDDLSMTLGSVIPDMSANVEGEVQENISISAMHKLMEEILSPTERQILEMRYGLGEYMEPIKLTQIGSVLGFSKQRIKQMEDTALARLKAYSELTGVFDI